MSDWLDVMAGSEPGRERARQSLLRIAEEVSHSGSWAWRPDRDQLVWSENLRRLWQIDARPVAPVVTIYERIHPGDVERVRGWVQLIRTDHTPPAIRFRIVLSDEAVRFMEARAELRVEDDGARFAVGWVQDLTERWQAEREIACHLAVAAVLNDWQGTDSGMTALIAGLCGALGLHRGSIWVPGPDGLLMPRWDWHESGHELVLDGPMLVAGRWLMDLGWQMREPLWLDDVGDDPEFPSGDTAIQRHFRRGLAVPFTSGGESLAVIGLPGSEGFGPDGRLNATLAGVGSEIGAFLSSHVGVLHPPVLTPREIEILRLASEGTSGPAIAARLHVSPATVKTHFENIYAKYEVTDRVAAVAKALREGLLH